jgi:hypothetical protein
MTVEVATRPCLALAVTLAADAKTHQRVGQRDQEGNTDKNTAGAEQARILGEDHQADADEAYGCREADPDRAGQRFPSIAGGGRTGWVFLVIYPAPRGLVSCCVTLEEDSLPDSLQRRCEVCGAELTEAEIHASREAGGPFLCSTHAAEQVPIVREEEPAGDDPDQPGERPSIEPGGA